MKKKLVLLLVLSVMTAAFCACSGSKNTPVLKRQFSDQTTSFEDTAPQEHLLCAPKIKSVQLNRSSLTLQEGEQELLCLAVLPLDASRDGLAWHVEDERIAIVQDGLVTALRQGTTAVHVTVEDGSVELICSVTVVADRAQKALQTDPVLDREGMIDDERPVIWAACADVFPLAVAYEELQGAEVLSYESSNERVVWVDSYGLVYALCPGSAVVRVHTAEAVVELLFEVEQVEQVMLTEELPEQKCVLAGSRFSMTQGQPFEGDAALTICSSDGAVAAIDATDVIALKKGSAQIFVYRGDELVYELFLIVHE